MPPYDPSYPSYREYPKWIGSVLVNDAAEEWEIRASVEAERQACEIRLRAERKAGQLLAEMPKAKRGPDKETGQRSQRNTPVETPDPGTTRPRDVTASPQQTLADLGISKPQSSRWQKLAEIPEKAFEETLAAPGPKPSTSGIIAAHVEAVPLEPARPPSSAVARMQLMRRRRREGKRAIQFEISAGQIEGLIAAGYLDPVRQNDVAEISIAIGRLLDPVVARIPKDT